MGLRPFSSLEAVAWTLLLALGLTQLLVLARAIDPELGASLALGGALEVLVYGGASYALVRAAPARVPALGLTRAPVGLCVTSALLGVALHGPAAVLEWLGRQVFPVSEDVLREQASRLAPDSVAERVVVVLVAAILAPFVEELFFRGALYARLRVASGLRATVALTAACFAVSHLEPRLWLALVSVGVVLGVVRAQNAGIVPCFLLHAAFNATTLAVAFVEPQSFESTEPPNPLVGVVGTGVCVALVLLGGRFARTAEGRT